MVLFDFLWVSSFSFVFEWRKRKGVALIQLKDGSECLAELHWFEATGIGRKEMKVKWLLD